ncbi:hypothetical protein COLO4_34518 [Corchorus olitorius]|uniref:Uncharacterized protein n=1 Tax=Corchorus olitorius TaxID=93759 RepID=A0A1R3GKG2_9ROSI|nr:hypothetical protein COLO4_34518 [Corchorus olitorius]
MEQVADSLSTDPAIFKLKSIDNICLWLHMAGTTMHAISLGSTLHFCAGKFWYTRHNEKISLHSAKVDVTIEDTREIGVVAFGKQAGKLARRLGSPGWKNDESSIPCEITQRRKQNMAELGTYCKNN